METGYDAVTAGNHGPHESRPKRPVSGPSAPAVEHRPLDGRLAAADNKMEYPHRQPTRRGLEFGDEFIARSVAAGHRWRYQTAGLTR